MIPEHDIERALEWLVSNSEAAAAARANRVYCEEFRKVVKATLMADRKDEALGAQERYAYAHIDYKNHLQALKQAIQEDERMRWLLTAAEAKISAWQTQQRMARTQERI